MRSNIFFLNYYRFIQKVSNSTVTPDKLQYLINLYRIEYPYVDFVEVINVEKTPYYDFTVNGVENMLIPIASAMNESVTNQIGINIPFITVKGQ